MVWWSKASTAAATAVRAIEFSEHRGVRRGLPPVVVVGDDVGLSGPLRDLVDPVEPATQLVRARPEHPREAVTDAQILTALAYASCTTSSVFPSDASTQTTTPSCQKTRVIPLTR